MWVIFITVILDSGLFVSIKFNSKMLVFYLILACTKFDVCIWSELCVCVYGEKGKGRRIEHLIYFVLLIHLIFLQFVSSKSNFNQTKRVTFFSRNSFFLLTIQIGKIKSQELVTFLLQNCWIVQIHNNFNYNNSKTYKMMEKKCLFHTNTVISAMK